MKKLNKVNTLSKKQVGSRSSFCLTDKPVNSINDLYFDDLELIKKRKNKEEIEYYNVSTAFDIEASSFYEGEEKRACMYAFVLGVNGRFIFGRTWEEFKSYIKSLTILYNTSYEKRLIIWVQNLSYEFQYIKKLFNWEKIFSLAERDPIFAITTEGIEFRCSYHLSNKSLSSMGKDLHTYKCEKMVGDLDYSLVRHSETILTDKEWCYIKNDGLVLMAYIQEKIELDGDITKIPLTNTGYVRNFCRNMCYYNGIKSHKNGEVNKYYIKYRSLMNSLKIKSITEYQQLLRAFQGGFTHSNALYNGQIVDDVYSFDFTSSYPTVMLAERHFPMSSAELIEIHSKEEFEKNLKCYCCLFDITFYDLENEFPYENYISKSKCFELEDYVIDNGRIQSAKKLSITLTELDYTIIRRMYKWSKVTIKNFRRYVKGYLPTQFAKSILKFYQDKTTLKDVEGEEVNYMVMKGMLNSSYGMIVTNPIRDIIEWSCENEWSTEKGNAEELIQAYNESKSRFTFYAWGIWVTALARYNLWTGILECKEDYIYSDTDSCKIINVHKHLDYFNKYNENIIKKLEMAMEFHKLPLDSYKPKNKKGKEKPLGVWDYEGEIIDGEYIPTYKKFKTLGAKRYIYQFPNGEYNMTVAGVNKKTAIPYLLEKGNPLSQFEFGLTIPAVYTSYYEYNKELNQMEKRENAEELEGAGKKIHSYIDDYHEGEIIDYLGKKGYYKENSSVHLEPTSYEMSASADFIQYILGVKERAL